MNELVNEKRGETDQQTENNGKVRVRHGGNSKCS